MCIRSLSALLAIVLATACASANRMSVPPNWQRYQSGELAGFLHAPDEQVVKRVPEVVVQRAKGRIALPTREEQRELPLQYLPTTPSTEGLQYRPPDYGVLDTRMFVVELRGPGASASVRTIVLRGGAFDFGPLPNGDYALKVTASGSAFALGWQAEIRTVIVSHRADRAAEIMVR